MGRTRFYLESAGLLVATTIGAGVFALPYLFYRAGYLVGLVCLLGLGALLIFAHILYARALEKTGDVNHLLGLARVRLGGVGFWISFVSVIGGLALSLVAYLILAEIFIGLLLPQLSWQVAVILFWLAVSIPILFRLGFLIGSEFVGSVIMAVIIIALFALSPHPMRIFDGPAFDALNAVHPFGATLFALAGWTAIPAMVDFARTKRRGTSIRGPIVFGTLVTVVLYALFTIGVIGSSAEVSQDTISGLTDVAPGMVAIMGLFGLFAIWTSYVPVALEIKDSLEVDLRSPRSLALGFTLFVPLLLVFFGFNNFLSVVGLVGGVFLSIQYALIMLISRHVLRPVGWRAWVLDLVILAFTLAALYEIYAFIVQ